MSVAARRIVICFTLLGGCFGAQAFFSWGREEEASATDLEKLSQALVLCPEQAGSVAEALDESEGWLSSDQVKSFRRSLSNCHDTVASTSGLYRFQRAYSALKALVFINSPPPSPAPPKLKLSTELTLPNEVAAAP